MKWQYQTTLAGFIILTGLDGHAVWVDAASIAVMREALDINCKPNIAGAAIRVAGRGLCVKETPEQIEALIKAHNARPRP